MSGPIARRWPPSLVLAALASLLVVAIVWALGTGAIDLPAGEVVAALWRAASGDDAAAQDAIVTAIRLPRILLAVVVGAGLATAGAALQGLFRNPLADPGLIGVSAGAAFGAATAIVFGLKWFGAEGVPMIDAGYAPGTLDGVWARSGIALSAFVCGLIATAVAWRLGRRGGGVAALLLAGIAVNATASAATGVVVYAADETQLRDITFWTLGSLGGSDWPRLLITAPLVLLPVMVLVRAGAALNALALGEHEAGFLGFSTVPLQRLLIVASALAVGAAVAVSGVIAFVGLIVPHLLRMTLGPDHRLLLPASALAGAVLVVAADVLARTVVAPAELPIGVLTALVGGPFFIGLLSRRRGLEVV